MMRKIYLSFLCLILSLSFTSCNYSNTKSIKEQLADKDNIITVEYPKHESEKEKDAQEIESENELDYFGQDEAVQTYILNTSTKKIHFPDCAFVKRITPENYAVSHASLEELITQGYEFCKRCAQKASDTQLNSLQDTQSEDIQEIELENIQKIESENIQKPPSRNTQIPVEELKSDNIQPSISETVTQFNNTTQNKNTQTYILNTSTKKIHLPNCSFIKQIKTENYATSNASIEELVTQGYQLCERCRQKETQTVQDSAVETMPETSLAETPPQPVQKPQVESVSEIPQPVQKPQAETVLEIPLESVREPGNENILETLLEAVEEKQAEMPLGIAQETEDIQEVIQAAELQEELPESIHDTLNQSDSSNEQEIIYVLNTSTKKIHYPDCSSAKQIKTENYATSNESIDALVKQGYEPCKKCKP